MPQFIIQCERRTWTKYIVEAEDEDSSIDAVDKWQYLGYLDGDDTEAVVVGGPFATDEEALADIVSYVEG